MNGSVIAIWIIVIVAVAGLAIWLGGVALAARKPGQGRPAERPRWRVAGGTHTTPGGGRSVAPRRDEQVTTETERIVPAEDAADEEPARTRRGSGNPLDL